jgi:hypothetical protein
MAHEPISTAYFINPFHQSVWLYVYLLSVLGNGSVKSVTAITNTHATIEGMLNTSFYMRLVSCGGFVLQVRGNKKGTPCLGL